MTSRRQSLSAEVYDVEGPLRVVKFRFVLCGNSGPTVDVVARQDLSGLLEKIAASFDSEISTQIYTRRHLRLYAGDTFYIVKPAQKRFWIRSAGMADGDSVVKDLMGTDRG